MGTNIMLPALIFFDFRQFDLVVRMQVIEVEGNKKDRKEGKTVIVDEAERSNASLGSETVLIALLLHCFVVKRVNKKIML